ncbi:protein lin-54 homolog [Saccoglossus kowalevskii]|uniref:Protein lin-54 homolog n=1 Tax=Saccoglossus kowalevskii TaxID=10224 RepID=A0ABM0MY18_SACKO|nr:PREDICTED: protein lin-54 homolog [Saccoglossus kowalevskii]
MMETIEPPSSSIAGDGDVAADIQAELDSLLASTAVEKTFMLAPSTMSITPTKSVVTVTTVSDASTPEPVVSVANIPKSNVVVSTVVSSPQKIVSVGDKPVVVPTTPPRTIAGIKRPASTGPGQYVTKVIITKNPTLNRPISNAVTMTTVSLTHVPSSMVQTITQGSSPVKLVTMSRGNLQSKGIVLSPLKQSPGMLGNKIAISPLKSPSKVGTQPISISTPKKIAPAPMPGQLIAQGPSGVVKATFLTMSTTSGVSTMTIAKPLGSQVATVMSGGKAVPVSSNSNKIQTSMQSVQQIFPGRKFTYVRLVGATNTTNTPSKTIAPAMMPKAIQPATVSMTSSQPQLIQSAGPLKMATLPIAPAQSVVTAKPTTTHIPVSVSSGPQGRLLMPANAMPSLRSAGQSPNVAQLPAGTTVFATTGPGNIVQGYAVVPAQFVAQLQQHQQQQQPTQQHPTAQPAAPNQPNVSGSSGYVPIVTNNYQATSTSRHPVNGSVQVEAPGTRPRKPCNCTKSQCLKLYCDCFANGEFCSNCNCTNCFNNLEHESERAKAIKSCLERNPLAFHPKIGKGKEGQADRRHNKGCNCKRSGCLKNYCECYEAKIMCSSICKCVGCKNFEESPDRKTLMHLADAAEVRVQQQTAAKTKLSSQIQDLPSKPSILANTGERLPFSFITSDVAEATCHCLLAQAEEAERTNTSHREAEQMILEEFGRCLLEIINSASKTKGPYQP